MTIREQLADDSNLFFDLDEMATLHKLTVGGIERKIFAIVDEQEGQQSLLKATGGIYGENLLFYAKTSDLSGVARNGMIQWDDIPLRVAAVVDEDGISRVMLTAGAGGF